MNLGVLLGFVESWFDLMFCWRLELDWYGGEILFVVGKVINLGFIGWFGYWCLLLRVFIKLVDWLGIFVVVVKCLWVEVIEGFCCLINCFEVDNEGNWGG